MCWILFAVVAFVVGYITFANLWIYAAAWGRIKTDPVELPPQRDILVLGTSPASIFLGPRLEAGARLYHEGRAERVILSGDGVHPSYHEVDFMEQRLGELGVAEEAVLADPWGVRTLDSMIRARHVFDRGQLIIVSQRFHLHRAVFLAQAQGIDAFGFPAVDAGFAKTWHLHGREIAARAVAFADVYLLRRTPRLPLEEAE